MVVVWARSIRQRTHCLRWRGVGVIDGGGGGKVMGKDWRLLRVATAVVVVGGASWVAFPHRFFHIFLDRD